MFNEIMIVLLISLSPLWIYGWIDIFITIKYKLEHQSKIKEK